MKKSLFLIGILMFCTVPAMAIVDADVKYLQGNDITQQLQDNDTKQLQDGHSFIGLDIKQSTEPETLKNGNYSTEAIRLIQMNKAYANARHYEEPDHNKYKNGNETFDKTSDLVRKFFIYLDPGYDDHKFFNRDVRMSPGFEDL